MKDTLTDIMVMFFDPSDDTASPMHLKKRDAQRMCNVLNGYIEAAEKAMGKEMN